jgi:hypothetical protein
MKKSPFLLPLILLFIASVSEAQTIKAYNGPFKVGPGYGFETSKGTYTYYEDQNTLERVKQGAFSYTNLLKNDIEGTYNKKVTGSYNKGLKNGVWNYNLTYSDFDRAEDEDNLDAGSQVKVNATGSITLIAPYLNGLANGLWVYKKKILYRDKRYFQGKLYVTPYKLLNDINISVSFKNGMFSGPISIKNTNYSISGSFDTYGNLDGQWTVQTKSNQETTDYKNGLVMRRVNRSLPNGEVLEKEIDDPAIHKIKDDYANGVVAEKDIELLGYTLHKRNVFSEKSIRLTNTLFNDLDFMYTTLLGDKLITVDDNSNISGIYYKGVDFYKLYPIEFIDVHSEKSFQDAELAFKGNDFYSAENNYVKLLKEHPYAINKVDKDYIANKISLINTYKENHIRLEEQKPQEVYNFFCKLFALKKDSLKNEQIIQSSKYQSLGTVAVDSVTTAINYYPQWNYNAMVATKNEFGKIELFFTKNDLSRVFYLSYPSWFSVDKLNIMNDLRIFLSNNGYTITFNGYYSISTDSTTNMSLDQYNQLSNKSDYIFCQKYGNNQFVFEFLSDIGFILQKK